MARKVKFPLTMPDGVQVRTLDELREHFDLSAVLGYYYDGRLVDWLMCYYNEDVAEKIRTLVPSSVCFKKQLCHILGVDYSEDNADNVDLAGISAKHERRERLRKFTSDEKILEAVERVAFTQEELEDLLNGNDSPIYLCEGTFAVSLTKENISYIGIGNSTVDINEGKLEELHIKGISFSNVTFCDITPATKIRTADFSCHPLERGYGGKNNDVFNCRRNKVPSNRQAAKNRSKRKEKGNTDIAQNTQKPSPYNSAQKCESVLFLMKISESKKPIGLFTSIRVSGTIEKGYLKENDEVTVITKGGTAIEAYVLRIERIDSLSILSCALEGDTVSVVLSLRSFVGDGVAADILVKYDKTSINNNYDMGMTAANYKTINTMLKILSEASNSVKDANCATGCIRDILGMLSEANDLPFSSERVNLIFDSLLDAERELNRYYVDYNLVELIIMEVREILENPDW